MLIPTNLFHYQHGYENHQQLGIYLQPALTQTGLEINFFHLVALVLPTLKS